MQGAVDGVRERGVERNLTLDALIICFHEPRTVIDRIARSVFEGLIKIVIHRLRVVVGGKGPAPPEGDSGAG